MAHLCAPLDGSLPTLPDIADFYATHSPELPWFVFPSKNSAEKTVSISFAEMVQASHRVAHILRPGRKGPEREVVALLLNTDTVLYVAIVLGILRAGLLPYPMSPRNSPQGVTHMLETTSCRRILAQASTASLTYQVQTEMASRGVDVRIDNLPSLYDVFPQLQDTETPGGNKAGFKPYPPSPQPTHLHETSMYIHSSGSTGPPKSIHFTYQRCLQWMRNDNIFGRSTSVRFGALGLPSFHGMGLLLQLAYPLMTGREVVVYPPQDPAPPIIGHPRSVYEIAKATQCNALVALPSFVEAWSHSPEIISYLKTLEILIYGGGPLSFSVGDKLVKSGVPLCNGYGGTEFGNPAVPWDQILRDEDWFWFRFRPNSNMRFDSQGDGTYELVVVETGDYHVAVHNVPGEKAYATSDLFEPHPTRANLWKIVGRRDDVIILSTGEKIVPIPQESLISANVLVAGCVMFGREREQPGVLIELHPEYAVDPANPAALVAFRRKIWPAIEEANAGAPGFAKIYKEMILAVNPAKPLPRAGKGTIIRKQALALYADEIEKLYETVAESTNTEGISPPNSWTALDLEPWLLEQASTLVTHGEGVSPTADLFQQGFDSLNATFFRNRIIGALRASSLHQVAHSVSANIIFEYPTVQQLALVLQSLVDPPTEIGSRVDQVQLRVAEIEAMIAKYTANLSPLKPRTFQPSESPPVVLLTGSTGNIGSHILAYLLSEKRVRKVYALNRPSSDPDGRMRAAFEQRGLPLSLLEGEKFVSLVGDVTREKFGLEEHGYNELITAVTHVVHNAWTVNFNLSLPSFEDQIAGVRKLIDISARSPHSIRLLITSSIGITNSWNPADGPVPEQSLSDPTIAVATGYTASKYVVEKILDAARACGVDAMAVRMGQACGPKATGAWGTTEWMPIMVKSSVAMGCLPAMHGPVAWIPLDAIGEAYVDWVVSTDALPPLVNVVHPQPTTWDVILRGICTELGDSRLSTIPLKDWVAKLENLSTNASTQDLLDIPAIKLLDFFRGLAQAEKGQAEGAMVNVVYETKHLLRSSSSMTKLQPMSEEHAQMWVRYWKNSGFIGRTAY